ncbi:MAG: hypothetical protein ACOC8A_02315 [bacterium]
MAATKDIARQVIASLPDDVTMDDIIQALYVREKFERGLRQVRDGDGISHEDLKRQMQKWAR